MVAKLNHMFADITPFLGQSWLFSALEGAREWIPLRDSHCIPFSDFSSRHGMSAGLAAHRSIVAPRRMVSRRLTGTRYHLVPHLSPDCPNSSRRSTTRRTGLEPARPFKAGLHAYGR